MRRFWIVFIGLLVAGFGARAHANGEAINGFPNWSERVLLEWMNRARSDPQADLAGCSSGQCAEKACYTKAAPPRYMIDDLNHSTRFHSSHLLDNSYFDHPSHCTLKANIDSLYPATCGGLASCSCTQGALTTDTKTWTGPFTRMGYFGADGGTVGQSEIIAAGGNGPDSMFYIWMYEGTSNATCGEHSNSDNGHRYILLTDAYGQNAGAGYVVKTTQSAPYGSYATMDFSGNAISPSKIPSGSHYPEQASSVDVWANWYDTAAPTVHQIDVDGVCTDLSLARGSLMNGAWHATISSVGTGCHRYVFSFEDSGGQTIQYPSTGSLAIGNGGASCADWSSAAVAPCTNEIFADGFDP